MTHPLSEVKPLEWHKDGNGEFWGANPFGLSYLVWLDEFPGQWRTNAHGGLFLTDGDAKAACQKNYDSTVKSALIQPTPAETEAWRCGVCRCASRTAVQNADGTPNGQFRCDNCKLVYGSPTPPPAETEGGWVLVPREPTHEMLVHRFEYTNELSRADVWSAMLAASPTPPPTDGEGDLVARLRSAAVTLGAPGDHEAILEAATAIESLSRQLEEAREALRSMHRRAQKAEAVGQATLAQMRNWIEYFRLQRPARRERYLFLYAVRDTIKAGEKAIRRAKEVSHG